MLTAKRGLLSAMESEQREPAALQAAVAKWEAVSLGKGRDVSIAAARSDAFGG